MFSYSKLKWRAVNLPVIKDECYDSIENQRLSCYGVDKSGHPLLIVAPRFYFPRKRDILRTGITISYILFHPINPHFSYTFHTACACT